MLLVYVKQMVYEHSSLQGISQTPNSEVVKKHLASRKIIIAEQLKDVIKERSEERGAD